MDDFEREPDMVLAGLSLWADGRQFPDSEDYWDGNWLNIRARVEAPGAIVTLGGPYLHLSELARFAEELATLHRHLRGEAKLECIELMLGAKVTCGVRGDIEATIEATPDHLNQAHRFVFELDQSYLGETLSGARRILARFPLIGRPQ